MEPVTPEDFWRGQFGDDYVHRNRVDWRARVPFWRDVIETTGARSVFEVGCNAGWNLSAIKRAFPDVAVQGCDINNKAVIQARCAGLNVNHGTLMPWLSVDLIVTVGVLIHIAPDELAKTMLAIKNASAQFVLAVEYAADEDTEVEYRGHAGKLWKRPWGRMYEALGLEMVREWDAGSGFDDCTACLLELPR